MKTSTLVTLLLAVSGSSALSAATAAAVMPPVFSDPTNFTNLYFPFRVGDVKIYRGKDGKARIAANEMYLADTRAFTFSGGTVVTRIVREIEFKNGKVIEIAHDHFAQADDGTIWYFGEVVDQYEDGAIVGHEGSWLVGGASQPSDPPATIGVADPVVAMPGAPEVGDAFDPEGLPGVTETVTIEKFVASVTIEAGTFEDVMRVREEASDEDDVEKKWHAPGVGLVRVKDDGEVLELIATTQSATPSAAQGSDDDAPPSRSR